MPKEKLFQIGVKALIVNQKGEYLLLYSGDWHLKNQSAHWDIPGGRIQEGESAEETLSREIEEEIGVKQIKNADLFTSVISNFKDIPVDGRQVGLALMIYKVKVPKNSKITLSHEHSDYEWVEPREAARRLAYKYPADFTEKLL